ncbi:tetratricopeptide repeat protein [Zavarzinella formosa]|uniref:tetratricopeptide repeat protein n=1 Tax=Zavarzinella formosa TaxID=360055 RepID=UPI00030B8287|nr:tetratricopeptide repeat protein [Zavarzinella formosa]
MDTMNAPSTAKTPRTRVARAAHKWYSWAGIALTITGSCLAVNGQLRLGDASHLYAAPPSDTTNVSWKPVAPPAGSEGEKIVLSPITPPSDPFKPSQPPTPTAFEPVVEGPALPEPFVPSKEVKTSPPKSRASTVLDSYVTGKNIIPVTNEVPLNLPPLPDVTPVDTAKILELKPVGTETPKYTPVPGPTPPIAQPAPVAPKTVVPPAPAGTGARLLPIPPAPAPLAPPSVSYKPVSPAPGTTVALQEPETLTVPPKPVETTTPTPKTDTPAPPVKKFKTLGNLSREDEIKLNAAQNAARLKDFNRAAVLLSEIIRNNPKEYSLRAEYAGLLLQAGDTRRAIAELEQVIRIAPNVAGYRLQLGDAYMSIRQYRAAASIFLGVMEMVQNDPRLSDRTPEVVIRAARALALDNDLFRAAQLVDRYLINIHPEDERAPLALGALLLDIDRPYDALPFLIEKRKQLLRVTNPENVEEHELKILEVLASMTRGFARVGERQQAMEAITEMAPRVPTQTGIRIALADILLEINEFELGGHVFNQVLAADPANGAALIGIARVYLETLQPAAAKRVLDSFVPNAANQRGYLMTYSSYHQAVGEYTEAKQIYRDMLRRNECDHEVRYALGRVLEYTKEWEKAKAEFAKIPPQDKMARKARLWFGMALLHQRKFAEAAQVAEQMMRDDPNNPESIALGTRALAKLGQFDKAINTGRGYLATNPKDDRAATIVRLAVGRALLEANRNLDAAREFEIALSKPAGRLPEAYYGLARSAERLGNADRAQQIVGTLTGAMGGDVRSRLLLADFYADDFEDQKVIEIAGSVAATDGDNLAALVRLADAQQRASRWPGNPSEAFATCQRILRQSPTNVRGHLAMARSFAVTQNFRKSAVQYDQLIAIDPEFTIPPRERARILYSDHQFSAARSQYNVMLSPTAEDGVMSTMAYYAQRDQKMRNAFGPYLSGGMAGPALRAELARIAATCGDDDVKLAAHRLICDYDATIAWQEPFRLERDAKELKGYRDYMAIPQYNAVNTFEPTNTETLFDEGQTYGALKMTRAALTWYGNCLAVDPTHRESICASERAGAEISPKLDEKYDWMSQRGRTGLASIDRQRLISAATLPIGDENEYVQFGYMRVGYFPTDDKALWGNIPFIRAQKKWDDNRLMTYGQLNVEQYQDRFKTRPTFDAGYWYDVNDVVRTRGGLYLENVAENGETLRQDIFRYGAYAGADIKPTRTWAFGGTYTYAHYSDRNDANYGFLYNEVALSLPPKMLKLVQRLNMYGFREGTQVVDPANPTNIFGAVHPYFSPDCFVSGEFRVEWWHWLSRDYYIHSNQCWYSLQYGIITDNNLVTYHDMKAIVNWDINTYFSVGAEGRATISSGNEYNMYSAMGYLQIRFAGQ